MNKTFRFCFLWTDIPGITENSFPLWSPKVDKNKKLSFGTAFYV